MSGLPDVLPRRSRSVWRVRDRATFARFRAEGRRVKAGPITVWFVAGDPGNPPRVAYAIGRAVGTAVDRNRLRRRLRAIVSDPQCPVRSGAYLIGVAPPAANLSWKELQAIVSEALESANRLPATRGTRGLS